MPGLYSPIAGDLERYFLTKDELSQYRYGNLLTWGYNIYGQLGDSTNVSKSIPGQVTNSSITWDIINCGTSHSAAIKTDGSLWCWGRNDYGQLGNASNVNNYYPIQTIAGGANWSQVSSGAGHTVAIKTDGTLWCWGSNANGQLGDNTTTNTSSPVQTVAGGTSWSRIGDAITNSATAAIKTDGTLWCWGYNIYGQLGDNSTADKSSPVQTVAGGTNWSQVGIGTYHMAGIKTDGTLWCWGSNANGQLGDNTTTNTSSPVQTVAGGTNWKEIKLGDSHSAAIKTDGSLWLCGRNSYGQLGNNSTTNRSSPVQTVTNGTDWKQVSCGYVFTTAIKTDGSLWCWGRNDYGQLGDDSTADKSSPVQTTITGTNWKQVSCGVYHAASIRYPLTAP